MNLVFFTSIILKAFGAILEVVLQVLITRGIGIQGYGTYSAWINAADLMFWICFSGLIKCNTFYLSRDNSSIEKFRKCYYICYVVPVVAVIGVAGTMVSKEYYFILLSLITLLELAVLDQSSMYIVRGRAMRSLIGEYILGRVLLLLGTYLLFISDWLSVHCLLVLYIVQYVCVLMFYKLKKEKTRDFRDDISSNVSLSKWGSYQKSDIMQSMIGQMPVVLQYFLGGGFEAGVVSIVLLIKKLINFMTGPTAKIFLPEFSKAYHYGEKEDIRKSFASIMCMQMMFVGPVAVLLIGFPNVVLRILAEELLDYSYLFRISSIVFLIAASLGPCGGVMQMTGNEKKDNRYREIAIIAMVIVMVLFSGHRFFVLYGLCVQTAIESVGKYIFVCRWMEKAPMNFVQYMKWWIVPICAILLSVTMRLQNSFWNMILFALGVFVSSVILGWKGKERVIQSISHRRKEYED